MSKHSFTEILDLFRNRSATKGATMLDRYDATLTYRLLFQTKDLLIRQRNRIKDLERSRDAQKDYMQEQADRIAGLEAELRTARIAIDEQSKQLKAYEVLTEWQQDKLEDARRQNDVLEGKLAAARDIIVAMEDKGGRTPGMGPAPQPGETWMIAVAGTEYQYGAVIRYDKPESWVFALYVGRVSHGAIYRFEEYAKDEVRFLKKIN